VSAGFTSGDRFMVGHWASSPIGPLDDVMWGRPDGERVLLASDEREAAFITAVYRFDRVEVGPVRTTADDGVIELVAGDLELRARAGRGWRLPLRRRPAWFTRWVEGPVARAAMGVRTYGTSPTGVREWYQAERSRPVVAATARLAGRDLGALQTRWDPVGVGFTEPPRRPSWVDVRPLLEDPSGRLDALLAPVDGRAGTPQLSAARPRPPARGRRSPRW
jgi:hypothetical protein